MAEAIRKVNVVGHQHPDTDSICAAITYADLLRRCGHEATPCRQGPLNEETKFILKRFIGSGVFNKCTSLKSIAIPDLVTSIPNGAFFLSGLETIELPKNLSRIEASAFCRCYNLKEINIPDSVTFIGHDAFSQCFELNEVHIS